MTTRTPTSQMVDFEDLTSIHGGFGRFACFTIEDERKEAGKMGKGMMSGSKLPFPLGVSDLTELNCFCLNSWRYHHLRSTALRFGRCFARAIQNTLSHFIVYTFTYPSVNHNNVVRSNALVRCRRKTSSVRRFQLDRIPTPKISTITTTNRMHWISVRVPDEGE